MCGNFGLALMLESYEPHVRAILQKMTEVTMIRGAQSGGIVTFTKDSNEGMRGLRSRIVNGKRTNLSILLLKKLVASERWARLMATLSGRSLLSAQGDYSRLYCGHTRFATSSKATIAGTHPHQWTKPEYHEIYRGDWKKRGGITRKRRLVELFVTHNGDFDAWDVGGATRNLEDIQKFLVRATWSPLPSSVDSCAIAGVMDILNAKGSWFHALRRAYFINGELHGTVENLENMSYPTRAEFLQVCRLISDEFEECSNPVDMERSEDGKLVYLYRDLASPGAMDVKVSEKGQALRNNFPDIIADILKVHAQQWIGGEVTRLQAIAFATAVVDNFYDADLLHSTRYFLAQATGSFGLSVSSSLESHRRVCLAARGQTMSVAFYPRYGMTCWASEAAATKSPLLVIPRDPRSPEAEAHDMEHGSAIPVLDAVGFDLDNLKGEICLLDWGCNSPERGYDRSDSGVLPTLKFLSGKLSVTLVNESTAEGGLMKKTPTPRDFMTLRESLKDRLYNLQHTRNPLPAVKRSTLSDILDIPDVCARIQRQWRDPKSANRVAAESLGQDVHDRFVNRRRQSRMLIDVLLTGCEASLWVAEHFASDLNKVFPNLHVRCISANKVLGLLGQSFKLHSTGFDVCEETWDLSGSIVIIVSHSGATFAPLSLCSLLGGVTNDIYTVTSGQDTEIAKLLPPNKVFSTGIGLRPAEPCTVSVVATHQILTQVLLHLMKDIGAKCPMESAVASYECSQIQRMNDMSIKALENVTGATVRGEPLKSAANDELKATGSAWADHCIEAPLIWLVCFFYIFATVGLGIPPAAQGIAEKVNGLLGLETLSKSMTFALGVADALVYIFMPQVATIALRIVQRRPLLHRMTGRSVLICDTPMVSQCVEAMASKMFACTYSNTNVAFYCGNPSDHMVHRFTHRTARGLLIACGRPDGRLTSLASAEAASCLGIAQACSIINLGEGAEAVTVGHNPAPLPLAKKDIELRTLGRPKFLCEVAMEEVFSTSEASSANTLLGRYSNLSDQSKRALAAVPVPVVSSSPSRRSSRVAGNRTTDLGWASRSMTSAKKELFPWTSEDTSAKKFFPWTSEEDTSATVEPPTENYFGEALLDAMPDVSPTDNSKLVDRVCQLPSEHGNVALFEIVESQDLVMRMYESRFACIERLVAFFVLFHAMAKKVRDFWAFISFGILTYDIERTQSMLRVATTASPVSGAMLRDRTVQLALETRLSEKRAVESDI
jgi:hypothetical protein